MTCPPVEKLVEFASGTLAEDAARAVEEHIDGCCECRGALSNLARGDAAPSFGRYRIDTVLGSGGMGIVYRAWDPQLARPVAIKVVRRAGEDTQGRARLVREAQALARLSHPNVCHVYDVGTEGDEVWVAMELVDGVTLRQWATGRAHDEVLATLLGAAEGIGAAHGAGLVHRDVKPENVLIGRDDRAIVTDFGLARPADGVDPSAPTLSTDPRLTVTGAIAGTPAYIAPEQLTGDPIDARVDQFAWAVMAWELLVGARPFPIVFAARLEAVLRGLPPPPGLPRQIAAALVKAMAYAPRDRFASMRELIDAMRAPVAPEVPARRPRKAAAIAGVAVLGGTGIALGAWRLAGSSAPTPEPPPPQVAQTREIDAAPAPDAAVAPAPPPDAPGSAHAAPPPPPPRVAKTIPKATQVTAVPPTTTPAPAPVPLDVALVKRPYPRASVIGDMELWCTIPMDPKHVRGSGMSYADWGRVTKVTDEVGTLRDEPYARRIYTVAGARRSYRILADQMLGRVEANVGEMLLLCPLDELDMYRFPGGTIFSARGVAPLSAPPRVAEIAQLGALHIRTLDGVVKKGQIVGVDPSRRFLVHAPISNGTDGRVAIPGAIVEVPAGIPGAALLTPGSVRWVVVEKARLDDDNKLVVTAMYAIDELFP